MISKKELQYVGGYPNKVPFPGKNYAISVMEYLKKCLEVYKDVYSKKTPSILPFIIFFVSFFDIS